MRGRVAAGLVVLAGATSVAASDVLGRVSDAAGSPVAGAIVRAHSGDAEPASSRTDGSGEFVVTATAPLVLEIDHPDFEPRRFELDSVGDQPVEVALERRKEIVRDEIAVSVSRSQGTFSAQSIAASALAPEDLVELPNAVGEMVAEVPGVSQNGQGGLFQTYSVRGVSRQRVLTLVEGMRIVSERRAGVSASFLDPLLLGSVEVVRGPLSTYWGSGALGGVVQLFARRFDGVSAAVGFSTAGDERFLRVGHGGGEGAWSWGLAGREAGPGETPRGEDLHSGFEQISASFTRRWVQDGMTYEALVLASQGRDIGKANTDFPERTTTYPDERHALIHLAATAESGWRFEAWAHPNELDTRVETSGEGTSRVGNRALDWGVDAQREVRLGANRTLRWGIDLFARQDVGAREEQRDTAGAVVGVQETLASASEQELGAYGAIESTFGDQGKGGEGVTLLAGGRLALQRQENPGFARVDDSAATAFVGAVAPLARGFELTANLGTGLRFPSISERFFSGTTGRGFVTGNPDLDPESSLSADIGARWLRGNAFVSASVFRTEIDDYIERVETAPGRLTFVNLASGQIRGLELDGAWQPARGWGLSFGGHVIEGEADDGATLTDTPPESINLGWNVESGSWQWRSRWEHRFAKSDIGSGEKAIPAAHLLSSSLIWKWRPDVGVRLSARNLLDQEYFNSADRRVAPAQARSLAVTLEWRR